MRRDIGGLCNKDSHHFVVLAFFLGQIRISMLPVGICLRKLTGFLFFFSINPYIKVSDFPMLFFITFVIVFLQPVLTYKYIWYILYV